MFHLEDTKFCIVKHYVFCDKFCSKLCHKIGSFGQLARNTANLLCIKFILNCFIDQQHAKTILFIQTELMYAGRVNNVMVTVTYFEKHWLARY